MRIAFIDYKGDPLKPGQIGLSDLAWDMATYLARLGEEVYMIGPYRTTSFPDPAVRVRPFALPPLGERNIVGHVLMILKAYQEVRRLGRLDVIHSPEYLSSAILATLCRDTPVVFTEPGNIYERLANGNPYDWSTTQVFKLAARVSARRCAHCFATSELMRSWWHWTGFRPGRISLVPLGVNTTRFCRVPAAKARLAFDPDRPAVLYAARLSRENGADVLLRALPLLKEALPGAQLHMLGAGVEEEGLRRLAGALGIVDDVVWHGWASYEELPLYYSAADVFAFSGFSGGTPRVMIQAMACGAPIVASEIGGITDHITHGTSGLLFPAGDHERLAQQLARVLADRPLANALGAAGRDYILAQLDWGRLVQDIRTTYTQLAAGRR